VGMSSGGGQKDLLKPSGDYAVPAAHDSSDTATAYCSLLTDVHAHSHRPNLAASATSCTLCRPSPRMRRLCLTPRYPG